MFFAGVFVGCIGCAGIGEGFAIGIVEQVFFFRDASIGEYSGRFQMIGMEVAYRATGDLLHRNALLFGKLILAQPLPSHTHRRPI